MRMFGIVGPCRGKVQIAPRMVEEIARRGLSISTLKRVDDSVDLDRPGKESYAHRNAGAVQVAVSNAFRWAVMEEFDGGGEPMLEELIDAMKPVDVLLVEGFHLATGPKCEILVAGQDRRPLYPEDPSVIAIVSEDGAVGSLPTFPPGDVAGLVSFMLAHAQEWAEVAGQGD